MLDRQTLADATERFEMLRQMDMRGLIDTPDLQDLLHEQKRVYWKLRREKLENQLKRIV